MFSIEFISPEKATAAEALGKVVFGPTVERFRSALGFWRQDDYERQWKAALHRIVGGRAACLITEAVGLGQAGHVFMYVGYPIGDRVAFQERFVQAKDLPVWFHPANPDGIEGPQVLENAEGGPVLEWYVTPAEIAEFLR